MPEPRIPFNLPAALGVGQVGEVKSMLDTLDIPTGAALEIDINTLQSISTAGVQLLLSADQAARRDGWRLYLSGMSEALIDMCFSMGLEETLSRWCNAHPESTPSS